MVFNGYAIGLVEADAKSHQVPGLWGVLKTWYMV